MEADNGASYGPGCATDPAELFVLLNDVVPLSTEFLASVTLVSCGCCSLQEPAVAHPNACLPLARVSSTRWAKRW